MRKVEVSLSDAMYDALNKQSLVEFGESQGARQMVIREALKKYLNRCRFSSEELSLSDKEYEEKRNASTR